MGVFVTRRRTFRRHTTTAGVSTEGFVQRDGSTPMTNPPQSEIALCLKRDGPNPAWGDLYMAGYAIEDLKDADSTKNMWIKASKQNLTRLRKET